MFRSPYLRAYGFWHWGEGLQTVLFTWYMTFHARLDPAQIGFYQALVLSPFLVFTVAGGVLSDRVGPGRSYLWSTTVFGLLLIGYGLLDAVFGFEPVLFFAYCLLAGLTSALSNPAIDTFIPEASDRGAQANGLLAATAHNLAKLSGTVTGLGLPLLLAVGGFAVNGLLMLLSVFYMWQFLQRRPPSSAPHASAPRFDVRAVLQHYRRCPESLDILLSSAMLGLLIVPAGYILFPLTVRERFPDHGDWLALTNISSWIGAIGVTWLAARCSERLRWPGRVSLAVWLGFALALAGLGWASSFAGLCGVIAVLGTVKLGKAMVYARYIDNAPVPMRGVLVAVEQTAFWGLATVGTFALGWSVELHGLNSTVIAVVGAIAAFVAMLAWRGTLWRLERR